MKCLVTGGAGFIGSHIVDKLIDEGHYVKLIDNLSTGRRNNLNSEAEFVQEDIRNYDRIKNHFKNIDYVFHTAALARIYPSFENPVLFHEVNVIGTMNCLMSSSQNGVKKFVYSSSSSCYGNNFNLPTDENNAIELLNPYAIQKYEGELYCKLFAENYGISSIVLRYFNVYGPRSFNPEDKYNAYSSPVEIFLNQKKNRQKLTITWDGKQKRDYVHVYDVARANLTAMKYNKKQFNIFNIASGKNHTVNEIAEIVGGEKFFVPKRKGEARVTMADITKAKKDLGWSPEIDLDLGIQICKRHFS